MYSDQEIQQVIRSTDIVDVVDQYVDLQRGGKNLKALCPFHSEDTPSFTVNPADQFFYCFGCKEGGNVIQFVMEIDGIGFVEAVERLAERSDVQLSNQESSKQKDNRTQKKNIYKVNRWAMNFFRKKLWKSDEGERARSYLKDRNLNRDTTETWKLGLAPDGWEPLLSAAKEDDLSPALLEKAGLIRTSENSNGYYDRFRNRLMFPIFDRRDRVVGFGGRRMPGADDDTPKYLNSPESPVFKKRELLYGWNQCDASQVREHGMWVAEGYTDVLMAHQHGLHHVTATLGTALGEDHVDRLRKRSDRVVLLFDSDEAGREASDRSLRMFFEQDTTVKVGVLPEGEDPCSLLTEGGADKLRGIVDDAPDLINYRIESARNRHDLSTMEGRQAAAQDVLETIRGVENEMRKQLILKRVAEMIDVDESAVRSTLNSMEGPTRNRSDKTGDEEQPPSSARHAVERACRHLVGVMVLFPEKAKPIHEELSPDDLPVEKCRNLYRLYNECTEKADDEQLTLGELLASIDDDDRRDMLMDIAREIEQMDEEQLDQMVQDEISYVQSWNEKDQLATLKRELKQAYREGDQERYKDLLDRVSSLQRSSR